jgi:uncharacterized protein Smg (DUF494 family)
MNELLQALMHFLEKIESQQSTLPDHEQITFGLRALGLPIEPNTRSGRRIRPDTEDNIPEYPLQPHAGTRIFDATETTRLTKNAQNFILILERAQILTPETREQVIDHSLYLEVHPVYPEHVKWITLMVLSRQSDKAPAAYIERLLTYEENERLH